MRLSDLDDFFGLIKSGEIDIYNEASVQFELGWFLRLKYPTANISLERNVAYLGVDKSDFVKSEMDLFFNQAGEDLSSVVELKAPLNQSQVRPITVFEWIKDVKFLEQVTELGIRCFSIFVTDHKGYFNNGRKTGRLLTDFRSEKIQGSYHRYHKLSESNDIIVLDGSYTFDWKPLNNGLFYFVIEFCPNR
jgi:hypothetical protein